MESFYAQALWKSIQKGTDPKEAVASLVRILKDESRLELLPRIRLAIKRIAAREKNMRPRMYIAHEKDAKHALAQGGVHDADVHVDATLIGGWRLETSETLIDNSFKKALLGIYTRATSA
jgi:F0F1-type ATP synthase delta subunit